MKALVALLRQTIRQRGFFTSSEGEMRFEALRMGAISLNAVTLKG
jgi:hypothetical protein